MDSSIYYGSGAINGRDDIRPAPRRSREPLAKLGVEWEGDREAKNKTDERCLDMGLNCAKLLSRKQTGYRANPICSLHHVISSCNLLIFCSRSYFRCCNPAWVR